MDVFSSATNYSITLLTLLMSIIINIILIFTVYRNNPKSATNKIFALLSSAIILWLTVFYISLQPKPFILNDLFWIRLSIFLATPMIMLFFLFVHTFPNEKLQLKKQVLSIILLFNFLVMAIALSSYSFSDVKIVNNFPVPASGPGMIIFSVFILIFTFATIYILIKKLKSNTGIEKAQIIFITTGITLMYFFMITTILFPVVFFQKTTFVPLAPLYTMIFIGLTSYAIVKHHLFNIKVISAEIFATLIILIFLVKVFTPQNFSELIVNGILFVTVTIFSIFLIHSVLKEVKMREEMELLAQKLETVNKRLKKLDEEKSEFLSIASHQLRAPMTVIKGYISLIMEGSFGEISEKIREVFNKIYISNERLIKVIDDLLDLSRIERGKMEYNFKLLSLEKLVSEIVKELTPLAVQKGLKIIWRPEAALPDISFDESYMRQVILNLVDNAIKYSNQGKIEIKVEKKEHSLLLSIKDEGMGISKETMPYLFQRYSRGEKLYYRATEGMGLGLYVAKKIIDDHRGKIWAESEGAGKGSTFFVELTAI